MITGKRRWEWVRLAEILTLCVACEVYKWAEIKIKNQTTWFIREPSKTAFYKSVNQQCELGFNDSTNFLEAFEKYFKEAQQFIDQEVETYERIYYRLTNSDDPEPYSFKYFLRLKNRAENFKIPERIRKLTPDEEGYCWYLEPFIHNAYKDYKQQFGNNAKGGKSARRTKFA